MSNNPGKAQEQVAEQGLINEERDGVALGSAGVLPRNTLHGKQDYVSGHGGARKGHAVAADAMPKATIGARSSAA